MTSTKIGISGAIVANVIISLALSFQKQARRRALRLALGRLRRPRTSPMMLLGILLLALGEILNVLAFGLAPASSLSPLGVLVTVANTLIPPLLYGAAPSRDATLGTSLALTGIGLLVLAGPEGRCRYEWPLSLIQRRFFLFEFAAGAIIMILWYAAKRRSAMELRCITTASALIGSISVISFKYALAIILTEKNSYLTQDTKLLLDLNWVVVLLLSVTVVSAALQAALLVESLKIFPMWRVVPCHFSVFTVLVGIGSAVLGNQFENFPISFSTTFILGAVLSVMGTWKLAKSPPCKHRQKRRVSLAASSSAMVRNKMRAESKRRKSSTNFANAARTRHSRISTPHLNFLEAPVLQEPNFAASHFVPHAASSSEASPGNSGNAGPMLRRPFELEEFNSDANPWETYRSDFFDRSSPVAIEGERQHFTGSPFRDEPVRAPEVPVDNTFTYFPELS